MKEEIGANVGKRTNCTFYLKTVNELNMQINETRVFNIDENCAKAKIL